MTLRRLLGLPGAHARVALAAGVFAGILLPDLAALFRPLLTAAVIGTLTAALLRLDWARLRDALRRPRFSLLFAGWQLVLSPAITWALGAVLGLPAAMALCLTLQAAAPPIGSAAVFALILGLDGALAVLGTVATTLLLPVTLTPLVALLAAPGLQIDLGAFFLRVSLLVAAPFALATVLRALVGVRRLASHDDLLGSLNVVLLVVFAIGVMDGVTARLLADPVLITGLLAAACIATGLLHLAGFAAFRWAGAQAAYSAAICSGNRNMGLMLVVTGGTAGAEFSLYVGLAQIPMYFAPLALGPFVRRARGL